MCMQQSEGNLQERVLSPHHVDPADRIWVVSKHFYELSHLAEPNRTYRLFSTRNLELGIW